VGIGVSKMIWRKTVNNATSVIHVKKSQQSDYRYHAYDQNLNQNIIALTKEGVGIRGTARLLGISPTTLISRIKKIASQIKAPPLVKGKTYEVDELRTFVKKKEG
jgi:insertion element IS1 protein InsB